MMKLVSFGSSSNGNCHILYNGVESLMLDCGVRMKQHNHEIDKYNVVGILISHFHTDHCKGIKDKSYLGNQPIYSNKETLDFLGDCVMNYRKKTMIEMKPYEIGKTWIVVPINVIHDVKNFGYIIKDKISNLTIAYFTDLGYSDNLLIKGVNVWIIECNHVKKEIEKKLEESIEKEESDRVYYNRVLSDNGHLSLEDSCKLIKNNCGLGLKHIILCHISNAEKDFKRYKELYQKELKTLEMPLNSIKIHAINNHITEKEIYDILPKNKYENMELD